MDHVSLDLRASNLEVRPPDLDTWMALVEQRVAEAAARGAQMLVMPELACTSWLSFAPADLAPTRQLGWLAEVGQDALPRLRDLAARYGVSLLPGTIPAHAGGGARARGYANRAYLLTPAGATFHQDKLSLTPVEAHGTAGVTVAQDRIGVIEWNGLRVAIAICLDAEFTALWPKLGQLDLDLVIVPAKTETITGYTRVFACARARAIELQTAVCVVGAVGSPLGVPLGDTGVGGASAFLPCDWSLSPCLDGVYATIPPHAALDGLDPVLPVHALPIGQCRRIRQGGAEAETNPAGWSAEHLVVEAG